MKLIVQIPALNEEKNIANTISDIPENIPGIGEVKILLINDGSTDGTVEEAKKAGIDYLVNFKTTQGLARAFQAGMDACIRLGADIIINTDADNQYTGKDIEKLVRPIIEKKASIVVGDRVIKNLKHFSPAKKLLQGIGSWVVRHLSGTDIPDVTSGFRAYSRQAALRLNVLTEFTYTLEIIIQAGKKRMDISHVPIESKKTDRPSRLFKNSYSYIKRSVISLLRIYTMYEPLKVFFYIGFFIFGIGAILFLRFLYFYFFTKTGSGHIQSLIFGIAFVVVGVQIFLIGLVADLLKSNRKLIEQVLYRLKKQEHDSEVLFDIEHVKKKERKKK